jgi:hypothetical protein
MDRHAILAQKTRNILVTCRNGKLSIRAFGCFANPAKRADYLDLYADSKLAPAEKDYSVRSACMGSMYAALRAGISAAINPIAESVTATAT